MPGLYGCDESLPSPVALSDRIYRQSFNEDRLLSTEPTLGIIHHGSRDPGGHLTVESPRFVGAVYGALFNRPQGLTRDLVEEVLADPERVLPTLEGSFSIACLDRETGRFVLATDKVGSRSIYFTDHDPFVFSSELTAVLAGIDEPTIDRQSVSDLLSMIHIWGDRTLIEEARSLRPASYLLVEDGERRQGRYWSFSFGKRNDNRYVADVARAYTDAVTASLDTVSGDLGVWLSGGLDSRMLVAILAQHDVEFSAYSYDRPLDPDFDPFRGDVEIASEVADRLGVHHEVVSLTPERCMEMLPELVEITDGQVAWNTLINLAHSFEVDLDGPTVIYEGLPDITGEKIGANHLGRGAHPASTLSDLLTRVDTRLVKATISGDIEPMDTFIDEVRSLPHTGTDDRIKEATYLMYNSRKHYSGSNKVARAFSGTRVPLATDALLELMGQVPDSLRRRPIPFTGGKVPHHPSPMKLALMRTLDGELLGIPYEATQLPPSYPHALHGAGFAIKSAIQYSFSNSTAGEWYREHDYVRTYLDELVHAAAQREVFNEDAIMQVRRAHLDGEGDHIVYLSAVTTIELFYRHVLGQPSAG